MARTLTAAMQTGVAASALSPVLLYYLDFSGGAIRAWTGFGDLVWNGDTYAGLGDVIGVGDVRETAEERNATLTLTLAGAPASLISLALNDDYQGRTATLWLGLMDGADLVADPVQIFSGYMDVMSHEDAGETADFRLELTTKFAPMFRPNVRRWTREDQQTISGTDQGFDQVTALQDAEIVWGR